MPISKVLKISGLLAGVASLAVAVGCGGAGVTLPHTSGNYSNASFKGSYVFQMRGFDALNGNPYRQVGVITADGNGNITAGTDDVTTVGLGAPAGGTSITGSYSVANDGTGSITLNSTALGTVLNSSPISFALTLTSSSAAYLEEADIVADGAGTADLQDPAAISTVPSGAFVFRLHYDSNAQSAFESQVGQMTLSGGSVTGSFDQNILTAATSLTFTSGTLSTPATFGAGTGTYSDSSGATTTLLYFIVNSGKFVFMPSNGSVGEGSAEAQTGAVSSGLAGTYAFGSRGDDLNTGVAGSATVGEITSSGGGFSGALDATQDGSYSGAVSFTGAPSGSPSAQGRVQITLNVGGTVVVWMVNPSRAFFLFEDTSAVEDGTADLQTASTFSASTFNGQYAIVMDGIDLTPEAVARVGTMQFDGSSKITLLEVVNDSASQTGATSPGTLTGSYQVGGSGRITTQINSNNGGGPDLVMYAISGSQAYALQTDNGSNTSGTIQLQQ